MSYDLGDAVWLGFRATTASGNLTSAAVTVTVTITQPDGVTVTPAVTPSSVGQYETVFTPTQAGLHAVRWAAVGADPSAHTDSFDVRGTNPRYIVSLEDAKELLQFTDEVSDEVLRGYNEAATYMIERYLDQTVVRKPVAGERHCAGGSLTTNWYPGSGPYGAYRTSVFVDHRPVLSLTAVGSVDGLHTWDPTLLYLNGETGEVTTKPGSPGLFGDLLVDYVAGYQVIPANIQESARMMIQHLWATRRGLGGNLITQQLPGFNIGFAIPQAVKDLLGNQPPVFA